MIYFNSIKVRLERMSNILVSLRKIFQFHKGTIRTLHQTSALSRNPHFNSIKVRLERVLLPVLMHNSSHFNSIKVRLEPSPGAGLIPAIFYFNSIKVRLEPAPGDACVPARRLFQFHKGTIRTREN